MRLLRRLPAMPYPMNKGQGKTLWTTAMNRSKQAGMGNKTIIVLPVILAPASLPQAAARLPFAVCSK